MHLLTILPLVCVFFCTANCLLTTHTAFQTGLQPTSRQSSSSQVFSSRQSSSSNRTSSSSQRLSSSQQRSTGSVAVETNEPFLRTGKDTSKYAIHQNSSAPLNTTKFAFKGNSSSPINTTIREDTTAQYLTYNVWTIDSTDGNGNRAIWNYLVSLGVDGSDINVLGLPPGLNDTDAFQLKLSVDQYRSLNASVSTCGLVSRQVEYSLYVKSKKLGNLDFVAQACVTGCEPIFNFIEEPPVETSGLSKRDFTMQFQRPWDQAYLSQPKTSAEGVGASMADINGRYAYDVSSAEGVTIYMVDSVSLSFLTARSLADECFRVLLRTTGYGSCSPYDDDDGF